LTAPGGWNSWASWAAVHEITQCEALILLHKLPFAQHILQFLVIAVALKCLRRFGSATDAALAVQITKASYTEVRAEALRAAVALSPGAMGVATELVDSDEVELVRAGIGAIWNEEPDIVKGILFPVLRHSKTEAQVAEEVDRVRTVEHSSMARPPSREEKHDARSYSPFA
jgi:hypothetical protein